MKIDEEFTTNGASINDTNKVFKEFGISARLFDCMGNFLQCCDPPTRKRRIKDFCGLIKNDHIYTMNQDFFKQLKANRGIKKEYSLDVNASTGFHINTRDEPIERRMIDSVDDSKIY